MTPTLLRGFFLVALVLLFGTLVSLAAVAPAGLREADAMAPALRRRLARLALWACGMAILLGLVWAMTETAVIAGAGSLGAALAAVGPVARETQFGRTMLIRIVLLLLALPLLAGYGRLRPWALLLAGAALVMQGEVGHAGAIGGIPGVVLLASEAFHLLGAGAWLGGLPALLLLVRALPDRAGAAACDRFFPVGLGAVVAVAGSAFIQGWVLIGSLAGLFGTPYGRIALLKLVIFVLLLALAAINRLVLTRRLRDGPRARDRQRLQASLVLETVLGVAVVMAAAFLASGAPPIDTMR